MVIERISRLGILLALAAVYFAIGTAPARADDVTLQNVNFDCAGPSCTAEFIHDDADPFKGWANFTITNIGPWDWLDFHIIIFEVDGWGIDNIDWIVSGGFEPTSNQSDLSWNINDKSLDLEFNSDPVNPYEQLTLSVYTDNTWDKRPRFGLIIYPTIIPEPSTALLLASGLVGLAIHGRRRRA
jgi:hypothetical protein